MKSIPTRLTVALLLLSTAVAAASENFRVVNVTGPRARAIETAAEDAYAHNAEWWFGKRFPQLWKPVPIHVRSANSSGGATTFDFKNGEVFGWRMTAQGTERGILEDVIPHEVNHVVFAVKYRRPLPRCLDEGAAQIMESRTEHENFRKRVADALAKRRVLPFAFALDTMKYPRDGSAVLTLYAQSHSVVEYLLQQKGKQTFVDFVADKRKPTQKLRDFYGVGPAELQARWADWFRERSAHGHSCEAFGCPHHCAKPPPPRVVKRRTVVYAFTASWCTWCQPFKHDVTAGKFPEFDVRFVDPDKNPRLWKQIAGKMAAETGHRGGIPLPSWWVPGSKRLVTMKKYSAPGLVQILGGIIRAIGRLFHNPDSQRPIAQPATPVQHVQQARSDVAQTIADVKRWKEAGVFGKAMLLPKLRDDFRALSTDKERLTQDLSTLRTESGQKISRLKLLFAAVLKAAAGDLQGLATIRKDLATIKDADGVVPKILATAKTVSDLKGANTKLREQLAAAVTARTKLRSTFRLENEALRADLDAANKEHGDLENSVAKEKEFGSRGWVLALLGGGLGIGKRIIRSKLA